MTAEIITIGDEILIGQIVDSNSAYIAQELNKIGISVHQISSIQDEKEHILTALREASGRADIILITGGLGPTKDDITKYTLCEYFSDQLVRNDEVLKNIERLFSKYKDRPLSELNKGQAMVPSKAEVLHNESGTAPGLWMEKDSKVYVAMPGVPFEMKRLMENLVLPKLQHKFKRPFIIHKNILVRGIPESTLAEKLEAWEIQLPTSLKLAYLPNLSSVRLRLSGKGENGEELKLAIDNQFKKVFEILGETIAMEYEEDDEISIRISKILSSKRLFLAAAESCTGGSLAATFTASPGASSCFKGGIVSYATVSKTEVLNVPANLIEKYSVVSAEVAESMAERTKALFKADFAVSTTGNAGPTIGDSDAEVGTVFIGLSTPQKTFSQKFIFGNNRDAVVEKTVYKALEMILKEITEE